VVYIASTCSSNNPMSYLILLKNSRWLRGWKDGEPYYSMRIGNQGRNGCVVPDLSTIQLANIRDWFLEHGIERDANHNLWWREEKFGSSVTCIVGPDVIYQGGHRFEISKDAYDRLFNSVKIEEL